jgi:hypothetical protein
MCSPPAAGLRSLRLPAGFRFSSVNGDELTGFDGGFRVPLMLGNYWKWAGGLIRQLGDI